MNETERQGRRAAAIAITELSEIYNRELTDPQIDEYINLLWDLHPRSWEATKNTLLTEQAYFPAITTIRRAAIHDPEAMTGEQAWELVCERIRRVGFNGGPGDLNDEIKAAMKSCGGWGDLCRSERPDNDRFHFVKAFNAAKERDDRRRLQQADPTLEMPDELMEGMKQIGRGGSHESI